MVWLLTLKTTGKSSSDRAIVFVLEMSGRESYWGDPYFSYESEFDSRYEARRDIYAKSIKERYPSFKCTNTPFTYKEKLNGKSNFNKRSYVDFKIRLGGHLLADHGDRMAAANSIEARYPFLDEDVIDIATRIPQRLKLNGLEEKFILKKLAKKWIPSEIVDRQKQGFAAPGSPSFLRTGDEWINDHLSYERTKRLGYFDQDFVETLKKQYLDPKFNLNIPYDPDILLIIASFSAACEIFNIPEYSE